MKKKRYNYEDNYDDIYDDYEFEENYDDEYENEENENLYDEELEDTNENPSEEIEEVEETDDDEAEINGDDEEAAEEIIKELKAQGLAMDEEFENNEEIFKFIKENPDLDPDKREELLNIVAANNFNTIYYVANKFATYSATLEDLIEAGQMGYAKAIYSYDPSRGTKFSTFAINCIQNEVKFHLRKVRKYYDNDISINAIRHQDKNGNDLTLEDTLADDDSTPEEVARAEAINIAIKDTLKLLTPRERHVLIYRFGLLGEKEKTQNEIAELLNMSQANISKIEKNCLEKMKELLAFRI